MNRYIVLHLLLPVILYSQLKGQILTVQGTVKSARYPIKQASVTFMNEVDTTQKYSAITDNSGNYQIVGLPTSLEPDNNLPADFHLAQNYPNPFSSSTAIPYSVNKQSDIKVTIYDLLGREVRQFTLGLQGAGIHKVVWDGRNSADQKVANGIYLYKLQAGGESQVKKMIVSGAGSNIISNQQINFPRMTAVKNERGKISAEISYTIRIENTADTSPNIIPQQIDNIQVNSDTTIDFQVAYIQTATIDLDSLHQIIRGFGAANIIYWRPDMTDSEIETAFGTGEGQLGFTILRLMVEADPSRWYLYVPTAQKAHDLGATIIASPWFAPSGLVETVNNVSRVKHDMYPAYAAHLDSFVTYMANNDVPIYGISVQNEPDITDQWTSWTADEMFTFMKENAQAITGTRLMDPESFHFDRAYSDPILNDSAACAHTDIICGHIYGSGLGVYPLAETKGKEVWMTEHLSGENNSGNDWNWSMSVASEMNSVMQSDMSAYVWWYIVRYYGPISDGTNNSGSKGDVTKKGYVMSQFSRFIRPGDYRVNSGVAPLETTVSVTAYKDSLTSRTVIVAVNTSSDSVDMVFKMQNSTMNSCTPYTTSAAENVSAGEVINISNNKFIFNLEGSSITTFVLN